MGRVSNRYLSNVDNKVAIIFLRLFLKLSFRNRLIDYILILMIMRLLIMFNNLIFILTKLIIIIIYIIKPTTNLKF